MADKIILLLGVGETKTHIWGISLSHNKNMLVCNIAIPVIFYPVIKTLFGYVSTQILNLRAENNFANTLKIVQKSGNLRDFWTIFNIFAKLIFALKFRI